MSASPLIADIVYCSINVRYVPQADISYLTRCVATGTREVV